MSSRMSIKLSKSVKDNLSAWDIAIADAVKKIEEAQATMADSSTPSRLSKN